MKTNEQNTNKLQQLLQQTATANPNCDAIEIVRKTAQQILTTEKPQNDLKTVITALLKIDTDNATTAQKTLLANRIAKLLRWYCSTPQTITADNVDEIAQKLTKTALNTIYGATANPYIMDILHNVNGIFDEIANGVAMYLTLYSGKTLHTIATANIDDGNGNKLATTATIKIGTQNDAKTYTTQRILKECLHSYVNTVVRQNKKIATVECWIEKPQTANGVEIEYAIDNVLTEYIKIDKLLHIDNFNDFEKLQEYINALNLTPHQMKILRYRLDGVAVGEIENKHGKQEKANNSFATIAQKLGVSKQAVNKTILQIAQKLIEYAKATNNAILIDGIEKATKKRNK